MTLPHFLARAGAAAALPKSKLAGEAARPGRGERDFKKAGAVLRMTQLR